MHAIRIVLGTMPPILRGIVQEVLGGAPDMEIVSDCGMADDLLTNIAIEAPDVVVTQLVRNGLSDTAERMLRVHPAVTVLGLSVDGRVAAIYQLQPHRTALHELSPDDLCQAIRKAVRAGSS